MELTQEYFEKHLDQKLKEQTKELKAYAREQTEDLARIIAETVATPMEERFARLESLMDVRLAVQTLQLDMRRIKEALHLK
jgi:hypothetical protein